MHKIVEERVDRVICLGDIVGYNAYPSECIALVESHCDRIVMGNHDRESAGREPTVGTSSVARSAQEWTQARLNADEIGWLNGLPNKDLDREWYIAVHGCYLNPEHINGYVTQTMLAANLKAIVADSGWPGVAFCGHTHVPMLAWMQAGEVFDTVPSGDHRWPQEAQAVLINPGSVGQPRDFDPRAAFAVVDLASRSMVQHRIEYDVDKAAEAVSAAGLPESLGSRLRTGR